MTKFKAESELRDHGAPSATSLSTDFDDSAASEWSCGMEHITDK